jgi:cobalt-zinc-cadmium efflux system membrane fusion protein
MLQGMKVKKGEVLVELQHPDYIQLQQDYLNGVSQLEFLQADYLRQMELAKENVNAQKTLQQAKAQFESMRATVQGLKAKLALLNLSEETIKTNGIQPAVRLYSPINGYVSQVNINIGKYASPGDVMMKLVNTEHIHAELQVFEKDIAYLQPGQKLTFHLANEATERNAEVYLIGREISDQRTVRVHCHLEREDPQLLPGMFITAVVQTGEHHVTTVPTEAIVHHGGKTFVFVPLETKNQFRLTPVNPGREQGGYSEIISTAVTPATDIVTKGAYTLLSLMFNSEE